MKTWPKPNWTDWLNTVCPLSHCGSPWARSGQHRAGHWGPACHSETMSSALYCMSKVLLRHWFSCFSFTSPLGFCIWGQNRQSGAERRRKSQEQWSPGKVWHFLHPVLSGWPLTFENGRCRLCHNADLLDPVRRWRGWPLRTHTWKGGGGITRKILMIWNTIPERAQLEHWGVQYCSDTSVSGHSSIPVTIRHITCHGHFT